jgi:hypothetical protein
MASSCAMVTWRRHENRAWRKCELLVRRMATATDPGVVFERESGFNGASDEVRTLERCPLE